MGTANKLDPTAFEVADIYDTSVCPVARIMRSELRKRGVESLKVVYSREAPKKVPREDASQGKQEDASRLCEQGGELSPRFSPVPASVPFVPPVAGLILAGEVVKDLIE